jgi:hypothetical protein
MSGRRRSKWINGVRETGGLAMTIRTQRSQKENKKK